MQRKLFSGQWKYKEGIIISTIILLLGFALEWIFYPQSIQAPSWPVNISLVIALPVLLMVLNRFFKKYQFVQWLRQVPAAMSSVLLYTVLVFGIGFISQTEESASLFVRKIGLTHLTSSFTMVLAHVFLLLTLGMVTIKRLKPFQGKNIGFFLNHFGLWIIMAGVFFGSADFYRLSVPLVEGKKPTHVAFDAQTGEKFRIPVFLELIDFEMDVYNPQLYWLDSSYSVKPNPKQKAVLYIDEGLEFQNTVWQFKVREYIPYAIFTRDKSSYKSSQMPGSAPAALIEAYNTQTGDSIRSWVSSGSFVMRAATMSIEHNLKLAMARPEAKEYRSVIAYKHQNGMADTVTVRVNQPVKIGAWKVYQQSYDADKGAWSDLSVVELITDPWLPVVYVGIFMMLAGGVYIFWIGRGDIKNTVDKNT